MALNPQNMLLGPARMYVAAFGSTEPLDSAVTPNGIVNGNPTPPGSPWAEVGLTDGGVMFEMDGTYTDLVADQVIMPVGARLTDLKAFVTTKMSEMTLANLNTAMNSIMTQATGSGYATAELQVTGAATQPTYAAMIVDGWAPFLSTGAPALRRIIVRKVLSTPKAMFTFDRKTQQSLDVVMNAYYVSSSILPVHFVDQTA